MIKNLETVEDISKEHETYMKEINNDELVDFDLEIVKTLNIKYYAELMLVLSKIKGENSGLTEAQKSNLKDLLQVIKSNKINIKDAKKIAVSGGKISVTLNSIVYCLELLGPVVSISESGKLVAHLQYRK